MAAQHEPGGCKVAPALLASADTCCPPPRHVLLQADVAFGVATTGVTGLSVSWALPLAQWAVDQSVGCPRASLFDLNTHSACPPCRSASTPSKDRSTALSLGCVLTGQHAAVSRPALARVLTSTNSCASASSLQCGASCSNSPTCTAGQCTCPTAGEQQLCARLRCQSFSTGQSHTLTLALCLLLCRRGGV